jgi:hypothetical protein
MKSFLLAALAAFGLLSSSAFAQQEGLTQKKYTRVVASGAKQQIGFYRSLNPDCISRGVEIRVTKQPEHGTVETSATSDYPSYPKENIRAKCNQHKVKGMLVNYKAAEKYTGDDAFDLLVLFANGFAWEVHYDVSVR